MRAGGQPAPSESESRSGGKREKSSRRRSIVTNSANQAWRLPPHWPSSSHRGRENSPAFTDLYLRSLFPAQHLPISLSGWSITPHPQRRSGLPIPQAALFDSRSSERTWREANWKGHTAGTEKREVTRRPRRNGNRRPRTLGGGTNGEPAPHPPIYDVHLDQHSLQFSAADPADFAAARAGHSHKPSRIIHGNRRYSNMRILRPVAPSGLGAPARAASAAATRSRLPCCRNDAAHAGSPLRRADGRLRTERAQHPPQRRLHRIHARPCRSARSYRRPGILRLSRPRRSPRYGSALR